MGLQTWWRMIKLRKRYRKVQACKTKLCARTAAVDINTDKTAGIKMQLSNLNDVLSEAHRLGKITSPWQVPPSIVLVLLLLVFLPLLPLPLIVKPRSRCQVPAALLEAAVNAQQLLEEAKQVQASLNRSPAILL